MNPLGIHPKELSGGINQTIIPDYPFLFPCLLGRELWVISHKKVKLIQAKLHSTMNVVVQFRKPLELTLLSP